MAAVFYNEDLSCQIIRVLILAKMHIRDTRIKTGPFHHGDFYTKYAPNYPIIKKYNCYLSRSKFFLGKIQRNMYSVLYDKINQANAVPAVNSCQVCVLCLCV